MARTNDEVLAFFNQRLRRGIAQSLPIEFEEVTRERVVVTMVVDERSHQPAGILHGGASLVLAETAASTAGGVNCPPGMMVVGQEINANHIRPKRDGIIRAVATPLHIGRTSHVWQIEVRDEAEKLICISRCTLAVVPIPEGSPGMPRLD